METQTKTRHSGKEVYTFFPLLFLFAIVAAAQNPAVIPTGGQQLVATMNYQVDLEKEGPICQTDAERQARISKLDKAMQELSRSEADAETAKNYAAAKENIKALREKLWNGDATLTSCVSSIALWLTGRDQSYTIIEAHTPHPTSGQVCYGGYQLYGPPRGKPYGERVYWVVLVKRDNRGQQEIKVLATQAVQGEKKPKP